MDEKKTQNIQFTDMTTCTVGTQTEEIVMRTIGTQTDDDLEEVTMVARQRKFIAELWDDQFLFFPKVALPIQKKRKIY